MTDLYKALGVAKDATKADIRKAYRKAAKTAHPDKGGSPEAFALIAQAKDILTDDEKRKQYDITGSVMDLDAAIAQCAFDAMCSEVSEVAAAGLKPEYLNIPAEAAALLRTQLGNIGIAERNTRRAAAFFNTHNARFKGRGIVDMLRGGAAHAEQNYRQQRAIVTGAIALLSSVTFDKEKTSVFEERMQTMSRAMGGPINWVG